MNDHPTTPEELEMIALVEQMQQIQAYMEKFNKEQANEIRTTEQRID